jgi:ABC-type sugar transport system permease subunit
MIFVTPMLVLVATFTIYPIFESARITMYNWNGIGNPTQYVGFRHFETVARDEWFWNAFWNTVQYATVLVPLQLSLTLILALILNNNKMRFRTLYRTIYFIPVVTSLAIVAVVVRLMLNTSGRAISDLLNIYPPVSPISSPELAMPSVILFGTWHSFGINLIYWLAALQTVPEELYDAAKVDGANGWQRLIYVTLPAVRPFAVIIMFLAILGSLRVFEQSFVLTQGGPYFASEVVSGYIYDYAFGGGGGGGRAISSSNLGFASAASFFMSLLVLGITLIQVLVLRTIRRPNSS